MIPLRLQLKNFLSYGPQLQTVDFEPYQLICLSGKNGHGKSALLDAITWALWGQARKIAGTIKADENLVRLGQTAMTVALDFSCQNVLYRVRREYSIMGGKAVTQLDFGILASNSASNLANNLDSTTSTIRSLTDKTIRATQEKINQSVGLDYEAFINSAFLRQGQANEFSRKSARERKEVLASILGLERYEIMRKSATDKMRTAQQERDVLVKQVEQGLEELKQKGIVQHNLHALEKDLSQLTHQEHSITATLTGLAEHKKQLAVEEQQYTRFCLMYEQLQSDLERHTSSLRQKVALWREVLRHKKELSTIQDLSQEQALLEQKVQALFIRLQTQRAIPERYTQLKDALHTRKEALLKEYAQLTQSLVHHTSGYTTTISLITKQLEELKAAFNQRKEDYTSNQKDITALQESIARVTQLVACLPGLEKKFERRKSFYHKYIAQGNFIKKTLKELWEKQELLLQASATPQCPLCAQTILPAQSEHIQSHVAIQIQLYNHQIERLSRILQDLKLVLATDHNQITELKKLAEQQQSLQARYEELCKQQEKHTVRLKEYLQQIKQLTAQLNLVVGLRTQAEQEQQQTITLDNKIAQDLSYQELSAQLIVSEQQRKQYAADEQAYHTALAALQVFTQKHKAYQQLMTDLALQDQRKKEIHELVVLLKTVKRDLKHVSKERETLTTVISKKIVINQEETYYSAQIKECIAQKQVLLEQKGALEHHKSVLDVREQEVQKARVRAHELDEQANEYQALAQALSKDGIQALLIEEAIPEVEHEANMLLARLTENQAHLRIESLKDLKSGATKETLDIKISDPMGTRPYELFSGGEAFRIDFALRVAISKLLARRAGAQLQTLIIDEGFGSQDEEGLNYIMEALYKIQEDFAKIIIVSHLSAMKDQFPVHFMIQKTPQGSIIRVAQQG